MADDDRRRRRGRDEPPHENDSGDRQPGRRRPTRGGRDRDRHREDRPDKDRPDKDRPVVRPPSNPPDNKPANKPPEGRPGSKVPPLKKPPIVTTRPPGTPNTFPPVGELNGGEKDAPLTEGTPVLLLPIRLETQYRLDVNQLWIRVFPDQVHIDSDDPALTEREAEAGQSFWSQWPEGNDRDPKVIAQRDPLWAALCDTVGPNRAGHVARNTDADGPIGALRTVDPPASTVLLPKRWHVLGFQGDEAVINQRADYDIDTTIQTSVDPLAGADVRTGGGLDINEAMAWMFDFDIAEKAGMGIRVDLGDVGGSELSTLLVIGVRPGSSPTEEAAELAAVLEMHERSSGLAFVRAGTPTNNLPDTPAGWRSTERQLADVVHDTVADHKEIIDTNAGQLAYALGLELDHVGPLLRARGGPGTEREDAKAMNRLLVEPFLINYLREMLGSRTGPGLPPSALQPLRTWFVDRVAGGSPLPALRIGPQPYGILPIGRRPDPTTDDLRGHLSRLIDFFEPEWRRSVENVPRIDPNATDTLTVDRSDDGEKPDTSGAEPVDVIPAVLAQLPVAARVFTRTFYSTDDGLLSGGPDVIYNYLTDTLLRTEFAQYPALLDYANQVRALATTIDSQIVLWELARAGVAGEPDLTEEVLFDVHVDDQEAVLGAIDAMLMMLNSWEYRQRPHRDLGLPSWNSALGATDPPRLVDGHFGVTETWESSDIVGVERGGVDLAAYLLDLSKRFADAPGVIAPTVSAEFLERTPLLYQVIDSTEAAVRNKRLRRSIRQALSSLLRVARHESGAAEIERMMLETLGLVTHRLDAWNTSLHRARLDDLRGEPEEPKTGIHVGAYGLVRDLKPTEGRHSSGFVHAPSLAHASTAAVLRSAWHSHGTTASDSPAAVDLSSARMRTADWVLSGIRNGQELGELLGYRFERHLHDHGASGAIFDIRMQAIAARRPRSFLLMGQTYQPADTTPNDPVDGAELLDVRGDLDLEVFTEAIRDVINDALDLIDEVGDAVADAALFDGTHQVVQGNTARAAAMFDAVSLGTGTPPELRSHLSGRGGLSIDHRVLVLVEAGSRESPWPKGRRDQLAPELETWAASLLPDPNAVGIMVAKSSDDTELTDVTLVDLGLSALDFIALCHSDATAVTPALRSLLRAHLAFPDTLAVVPSAISGDASLEEVQLLAREINAVLDRSAPATAASLQPPSGEAPAETSPVEDDAVIEKLWDAYTEVLRSDRALQNWSPLARYGWAHGEDPETTLERLRQRARKMQRLVDKGEAGWADALAEMFPATPIMLAGFEYGDDATGARVHFDDALSEPLEIADWLDSIAHVRSDVGRLDAAHLLSSLVTGRTPDLLVGQDVVGTGERWAALSVPPPDTGGRTSVCVSGLGAAPRPGGRYVGLVVDSWSEQIPNEDAVTGITFQFDAPSNRAPQAWLLASPPEGDKITLSGLADMVLDTVAWAEKRMVAPEDLTDWGHGLPMSILPSTVRTWGEEESV